MNSSSEEDRGTKSGPGSDGPEKASDSPELQLRPVFYVPLFVFLALLAVYFDPFGVGEVTRRASVDHLMRLLIGPIYASGKSEQVAVVLLDEDAPQALGLSQDLQRDWLLPLSAHVYVLRAIRRYNPKGVMVDFVFLDKWSRDEVETLEKEIEAFQEQNEQGVTTPIFFAMAETLDRPISPDLANLRNLVNLVSIAIPLDDDGLVRSYWLCARAEAKFSDDDNQVVAQPTSLHCRISSAPDKSIGFSAAFQMFAQSSDNKLGLTATETTKADLVWSNRFNAINDKWMKQRVVNADDSEVKWKPFCSKINDDNSWNRSGVIEWLWKALWSSESFTQPCPYTSTVPVSALISNPFDSDIKEALKDKFVFYGSDIPLAADYVATPTNPKIPGVYVHAMALDNLLTYEGRYKQSFIELFGYRLSGVHLEMILSIYAAAAVAVFGRTRFGRSVDDKSMPELFLRWARWLGFLAYLLLLLVVISYALFSIGRLSPANWIGMFALSVAMSAIAYSRLADRITAWIITTAFPSRAPVFLEEVRP